MPVVSPSNPAANKRDEALLYLNSVDITPAAFRAGVRLLLAASAENGYLRRPPADIERMFGGVSASQVRRILGQLQAVDVIHYTTNGDIHVYFRSWSTNTPNPDKAHSRAKTAHPCAENAQSDEGQCAENAHRCAENAQSELDGETPCAENAHPCAENAHRCAENAHLLTRTRAPVPEVSKYSKSPTDRHCTYLLARDPAETAVGAALLHDAGMDKSFAAAISAKHPLEQIRRALGWWWDDQQSDNPQFKRRPTIVLSWLQEGKGLPPLSEEFENSDLYQRHRTPAELATGDGDGMNTHQRRLRSKYIPDEFADIIIG